MEGTLEHARLQQEKRNRRQAAALSALLFVTVLVVCFFLTAFTTQEPPPGEQFVAVGFADLGSTEEAGGDVETEAPSEVVQEAVEEEALSNEPEPEQPVVQEEVVTQAASEVAVQSDPDPKPEPEPEPEPERQDRTAHLFRNPGAQSAGGGGSQGETQGVGNEGDEAGKIEGRGLVSGDFGDAMLRGGTMIGEPKLDEKPRQEGSVRINIVVDASGSVIQAVPDYQSALTTIRDSHHVQLAMRAAKTAKFDSDATKPRRSGYITIRFDLE
ncbi:MAG: energy transducer TonB family protein [Flavobacteriales bacterium]